LQYASRLALKNIQDLEKVIEWNIEHNMTLYRMSSDMFPWMSEYEFEDLPDIVSIQKLMSGIGQKILLHNHRLTFHPGPFNVLASANENVVHKTVKELRQHGEVMDMMGLPRSPFSKINIHIGGAYGDKKTAMDRFINNFSRLPETARRRVTIENDDKANMFSVYDLARVHAETGIPIVFDYLHHQFCMDNLTQAEAFELAVNTWPDAIRPIVHFSSSKRHHEDKNAADAAHADFIYEPALTYGHNVDIMLEAKAKEQAVFQYLHDFNT
jgi:UV DNA damage endonuclease